MPGRSIPAQINDTPPLRAPPKALRVSGIGDRAFSAASSALYGPLGGFSRRSPWKYWPERSPNTGLPL
eukprot:5724914-Pyramimonas_sp.AAC.1